VIDWWLPVVLLGFWVVGVSLIPVIQRRERVENPGSIRQFREWVDANRPDLAAKLGPLSFWQVQDVLEEETGLGLPGSTSLEEGFAKYLEALKAKHAHQ
jgi:hypothetical protein